MDNKKMMIIITAMVLLVISSNIEVVESQGPDDCYDGCSTACVTYFRDSRRMARCDRKCQIRCGPDLEANGRQT